MKMDLDKDFKIAQLIANAQLDQLDENDQALLNTWLNHSAENQLLYKQIIDGERIQDRESYVNKLDALAAWKKVASKTTAVKQKKSITFWLIRVAAILILGLVLTTVFVVVDIDHKEELVRNEADIAPGRTKAILRLASGEMKQLTSADKSAIFESDGTVLTNDGGHLEYEASGVEVNAVINTVTTPRGGEYKLTLADGTQVWMNADSKITFPTSFNSDKRRVAIEGEVFFDVAHDLNKPFLIDVNEVEVKVLGTQFNIEAYRNTSEVITTLVSGGVMIAHNDKNVAMKPNQQAIVACNQAIVVKEVEARNYTLWKEGVFFFERTDLETIMDKVSRWYNVEIEFEYDRLKTELFSAEIKRYADIRDFLMILESTQKISFKIKGNKILVTE